jgi:HSP20 family protein
MREEGSFMGYRRTNGMWPSAQLRGEMNQLVSEFFGPHEGRPRRFGRPGHAFPALNVWEDGDALFAEAEVPGLKSDDVEISVIGADLTITGRRNWRESQEGATFHRQERGAGEFNRVVRLPVEIDADKVEATLTDGVLLLRLPKAASAKPTRIKVTPGN